MIRTAASLPSPHRRTADVITAWARQARESFEVSSLAYLLRQLAGGRLGERPAAGSAAVGRRCAMGA